MLCLFKQDCDTRGLDVKHDEYMYSNNLIDWDCSVDDVIEVGKDERKCFPTDDGVKKE